MERTTLGSSSSALQIEVFPEPDGPERTASPPRKAVIPGSFEIRDLLAQPFDAGLRLAREREQGRILQLAAHGLHLAPHLLDEELELAAHGAALAEELLEFRLVAEQPVELLGHVGAVGEDRH